MFAHAIMFLGSTETSDCNIERLYNYARKAKDLGWNPRRVRVCIWPLSNFVDSARRNKPDITDGEVIEHQAQLGIRFSKTKKQAMAAGRALAAKAEEVITEVYGTNKRKRAMYANPPINRRSAA